MAKRIDENSNETGQTDKIRRRRRSRKTALAELPIEEPPVHIRGPKPAKAALKAMSIPYEPPYESPKMPQGQRAEHPEYDTGHAVARPVDVIYEKDAAA